MEIGLLILSIFKAPVDMYKLQVEDILSNQFKKYNTGNMYFVTYNMREIYFRNIPSYLIEEIPHHLNSIYDYKIEIVPDFKNDNYFDDFKNDNYFDDFKDDEESN